MTEFERLLHNLEVFAEDIQKLNSEIKTTLEIAKDLEK